MSTAIQFVSLTGLVLTLGWLAWDAWREHRKATRARRFRANNPQYFFRG